MIYPLFFSLRSPLMQKFLKRCQIHLRDFRSIPCISRHYHNETFMTAMPGIVLIRYFYKFKLDRLI